MRIRLRAWQHLGLPAETRAGALAQLQVLGLIDNTHSTLAGMVSTRLDGCPTFASAYVGRKRRATRISATWRSPTSTCAAFSKESRMRLDNAIRLKRKSGGSPTKAFAISTSKSRLELGRAIETYHRPTYAQGKPGQVRRTWSTRHFLLGSAGTRLPNDETLARQFSRRHSRSRLKHLPASWVTLYNYSRVSSTRRLRARPASVSLVSTGREAPKPSVERRSGAT
jgi:hypothetical protein